MDIWEHLRELLPHAEWELVKELLKWAAGAGVLTALAGLVQRIRSGSLDWWILGTIFFVSVVLFVLLGGEYRTETVQRSGVVERTSKEGNPQFPQWPEPYQPTSVIRKTFRNEKVLLDGHSYDTCLFENVTFVYNGTTAIQFRHNTVRGSAILGSENIAILGTMLWLKGFELLKPEVTVLPPSGGTEE